jgi:hypothetical protein
MSPSTSTIDVEKDKRDFVNEHHENNRDIELAQTINDNVGARYVASEDACVASLM